MSILPEDQFVEIDLKFPEEAGLAPRLGCARRG